MDDIGGSPNATPVQSASDGSPSPNQPLVEQLVSSARKNFEVAMNQVQHEIDAFKGAPTFNGLQHTSPTAAGGKSVSYAGATSNNHQKHVSNF